MDYENGIQTVKKYKKGYAKKCYFNLSKTPLRFAMFL